MQKDAITCCQVREVSACSNQHRRAVASQLLASQAATGSVTLVVNEKLHAPHYPGLQVDKWPPERNDSTVWSGFCSLDFAEVYSVTDG